MTSLLLIDTTLDRHFVAHVIDSVLPSTHVLYVEPTVFTTQLATLSHYKYTSIGIVTGGPTLSPLFVHNIHHISELLSRVTECAVDFFGTDAKPNDVMLHYAATILMPHHLYIPDQNTMQMQRIRTIATPRDAKSVYFTDKILGCLGSFRHPIPDYNFPCPSYRQERNLICTSLYKTYMKHCTLPGSSVHR